MSCSKSVRRLCVISSVAAGTFTLALAASPAYAGVSVPGLPAPAIGSLCNSLTALPSTLQCVNGIVTTVAAQLPIPAAPTSSPSGSASTSPSPAPEGNPVGGLVGGVGGAASSIGGTVGGALSGLTGGGSGSPALPLPLPSFPGAPSTGPSPSAPSDAPSAPSSPSTKGGGSTTSTSAPGSAGGTRGAVPPVLTSGIGLLSPAAFLPGSGTPLFADLGAGGSYLAPLADSIPSPLLASPEQKLAAVQAPLLAAGERAAKQGGLGLSNFSSKALPGILVVLGTAMVAAVGAGNVRAWQARLAEKAKKKAAAAA